jgi:hypothetical protein
VLPQLISISKEDVAVDCSVLEVKAETVAVPH